jgi:hypothetical protein
LSGTRRNGTDRCDAFPTPRHRHFIFAHETSGLDILTNADSRDKLLVDDPIMFERSVRARFSTERRSPDRVRSDRLRRHPLPVLSLPEQPGPNTTPELRTREDFAEHDGATIRATLRRSFPRGGAKPATGDH